MPRESKHEHTRMGAIRAEQCSALGQKTVRSRTNEYMLKVLNGLITLKYHVPKPTECKVVIKCTYHRLLMKKLKKSEVVLTIKCVSISNHW